MDLALSTWSLNVPLTDGRLAWRDLPATVAEHGIFRVEVCHFHLPDYHNETADELKAAAEDAGVVLQSLLADFGDLANEETHFADLQEMRRWKKFAARAGFERMRVIAGDIEPTRANLDRAMAGLRSLAELPGPRVAIENWKRLLPDAERVNEVLDALGGEVGLCLDFGNWASPLKEKELPKIAKRAETCHAKARWDGDTFDAADYDRMLGVLADARFRGPAVIVDGSSDEDPWPRINMLADRLSL